MVAASAFVAAGLALLTQQLMLGWRLAAELALVLIPVGLYAHLRKVPPPGKGRQLEGRQLRELSGLTLLFATLGLGSAVLTLWLVRNQALKPDYALFITSTVCATSCLTLAAKDRRQRSAAVAGIAGLLVPILHLLTGLSWDVLALLALGVALLGQALIWRSQLRALGRW